MKMITIKRLFIMLFVLLFIVGCSSPTASKDTQGKTNHSEQNQEKSSNEGGVVRIAMSTEIDNLDPYLSAATDTGSMMDNVFDGLLDTDENGKLVPAIAEKYAISDDGRTYTFYLKEGVMFHDGSELTADDVVYSYAKLGGLNGGEPLSSRFEIVEKVEAKSPLEVVVTLKEVDSAFLARNIVAIVPKDYEEQSSKPIGAGPFKFEEYKVGQELRLSKNENYYDKENTPKIDEVQFKIMPDPESSILAMQAGEIDILPGISKQGLDQLGDTVHSISGPQNMVQLMAMNNSVKPFDDVRVRQAINLAINKDVIIDTVADGMGTKLGTNMSPAMQFYYEPGLEDRYEQNIEKAKELLDEAGLASGFTMELTVPSDYQFHVDTAQVIADQLSQINIQTEIKQIEFSSWLENVYNNAQYETTIIGFTGKLDPYEVLVRYVSDYGKNFMKFQDERYDELIKEAVRETDETKKAALYKKAQTILTDEAAALFIMDPDRTTAMRNGVNGLKLFPIQKFNLEDVTVTK
ncbi:ABC transporter substrate-binding protein [Virgibacillus sp. LDC-1]|uniref:ABC transporter substrate-binding protein n=1 Tax=Virgibacillus sp. LDC-1 TaxID=3039856 RepID=UPI0024DE2B59|nr:ABC transporter substrate-binding protein [Virgibacillus sp. LDC-1]